MKPLYTNTSQDCKQLIELKHEFILNLTMIQSQKPSVNYTGDFFTAWCGNFHENIRKEPRLTYSTKRG